MGEAMGTPRLFYGNQLELLCVSTGRMIYSNSMAAPLDTGDIAQNDLSK